jgi:hypothetical protein
MSKRLAFYAVLPFFGKPIAFILNSIVGHNCKAFGLGTAFILDSIVGRNCKAFGLALHLLGKQFQVSQ